ncbi:MAG TPA: glycosyltransferase family 4 protein [Solirubrobacteraceae bacterium]|nr:glycosyltransferase family 4 protein [Solirubrobacteraceae bacterium]
MNSLFKIRRGSPPLVRPPTIPRREHLPPDAGRARRAVAREADVAPPLLSDDRCRSLRLLYVAEAFGGGLFEITRMLAESMAESGHQVAVAYGVRPETPADIRERVDAEVELIPLPWTERSATAQVRASFALRRLCRSWRPDVVHLVSSFAGLHGALAASGLSTVYTPQGYSFTMRSEAQMKRWLYVLLESFVARRVDVVGACSLSEGEQARALPGTGDVAVIPNGISELSAGAVGKARDENDGSQVIGATRRARVVAIGRPSPQRQPEACARMLSAMTDIADVEWVGGGPDSPGRRALVDAGVPVTGWRARVETLSRLAQSTVYLHWTAWDGLPLSVLEAMAHDVVVVASDIGPNREVLGPEQVCRNEAEALTLMRSVLTDDDLRMQLVANQRARRKSYGADRMAAEWLGLYHALTEARGTTRKLRMTAR